MRLKPNYDVTKRADADYENKLKNIKLKDSEAMNELNKLFIDIRITKDTPQQEVIDKILKWYGWILIQSSISKSILMMVQCLILKIRNNNQ